MKYEKGNVILIKEPPGHFPQNLVAIVVSHFNNGYRIKFLIPPTGPRFISNIEGDGKCSISRGSIWDKNSRLICSNINAINYEIWKLVT